MRRGDQPAHPPGKRAHEHHAAPAALGHAGQKGAGEVEAAQEVDLHHPDEGLVPAVIVPVVPRADGGIGHQRVDLACHGQDRFDLLADADVDPEGRAAKLGCQRGGVLAVDQHDPGPLGRTDPCRGGADPGGGPGDQHGAAGEIESTPHVPAAAAGASCLRAASRARSARSRRRWVAMARPTARISMAPLKSGST